MKLKLAHIILILVAALALGFAGGYTGVQMAASNQDEPNETESPVEDEENAEVEISNESPQHMSKVVQAFNIIQENYLEEVEDQQLIEGAIQGMLATLEDPYSTYMDVEMMKEFDEQIESSFEGIGAEVSMVNGNVTIVAPIKDSPAETAGLRPNDQILEVDGESLEGLDLNEAVAKIRGEKGSEVIITIMRPGASEAFDIPIIRDTIPVDTVYSEMKTVDGKETGIIEITNFSENTSAEFAEQLQQLEDDGMEGLVIDVRGNPGGLLNSVEEILGLFVPKDIPYVQIEDRDGNKSPYHSNLDKKKDYPINVIVNEGSASASEILAVAMKEAGYDVIGTTSFGKGTVQQAVPLGDGSTVKLTFFKWLSPEGNWIHEEGVEPTVETEQPDYFYTNPVQLDDGETLGYDQSDNKIENIQKMLDGLGYNLERTDGYFDKSTEDAVSKFQQENDLTDTGEVDQETASMIEYQVVETIREGKDDLQLEKALEVLY
ncbi:carboxyl-terminal processing protease [Oceanobacillus limi]|uniref:C-terminal processing peptidase n=1 Tax=Oceanobacillus limi TaxID=930131 RepID=A0A1I0BS85_9BACI|nr:S41 family peptidase [Oceanobacillus limi]SET09919.1 carboxyl-terminal processing protease [Oceanobacillus limi]